MVITNGLKQAQVEFGEGVSSEVLTRLFRANLILNKAEDGEYDGLTGKVFIKSIGNGFRLFVDVFFKDTQGNDVQLKYSNELDPKSYYIRKLFSDFHINYQDSELDLSPLSNAHVKIVVKNNGPYCNVIAMYPLNNEKLTSIEDETNREEEEDLNLDLDIEEDELEWDLNQEEDLFSLEEEEL